MNSKLITEYNKEALTQISKHLEFSTWDKEPVHQEITNPNFVSIAYNLKTLLSAIEFIGFNGDKDDLATCAGLAEIANKIVPISQMEFLDDLLINKERYNGEKIEFTPINQ